MKYYQQVNRFIIINNQIERNTLLLTINKKYLYMKTILICRTTVTFQIKSVFIK